MEFPRMIHIGDRLREARTVRDLNLRQLAEQTGLSASMLCTIENGKSMPSVQSLAAIAKALGLPLGFFFDEVDTADSGIHVSPGFPPVTSESPVVREGARRRILLDGGITWHRLTPTSDPHSEFSEITYDPGASSGPALYTHSGREWGHVIQGELHVDLAYETYCLTVGDSITFDSQTPHRMRNIGTEVMRAIWVNLQ